MDKLKSLVNAMKLKPCTCRTYNPMIRDYKLSEALNDEYSIYQCLNCHGYFAIHETVDMSTEPIEAISWIGDEL